MLDMVKGHLLQLICKPPLMKPTHKCAVKIPWTHEATMASEINSMLSKGTTEVGPGNKGSLHTPYDSKKE